MDGGNDECKNSMAGRVKAVIYKWPDMSEKSIWPWLNSSRQSNFDWPIAPTARSGPIHLLGGENIFIRRKT